VAIDEAVVAGEGAIEAVIEALEAVIEAALNVVNKDTLHVIARKAAEMMIDLEGEEVAVVGGEAEEAVDSVGKVVVIAVEEVVIEDVINVVKTVILLVIALREGMMIEEVAGGVVEADLEEMMNIDTLNYSVLLAV